MGVEKQPKIPYMELSLLLNWELLQNSITHQSELDFLDGASL